jgi:hypothetical protein
VWLACRRVLESEGVVFRRIHECHIEPALLDVFASQRAREIPVDWAIREIWPERDPGLRKAAWIVNPADLPDAPDPSDFLDVSLPMDAKSDLQVRKLSFLPSPRASSKSASMPKSLRTSSNFCRAASWLGQPLNQRNSTFITQVAFAGRQETRAGTPP